MKESLRAVRSEYKTIDDENKIRKLKKYNLEVNQLRNTRVAFIEHCNEFNCFYIDLNDQLQRITIATEKFDMMDVLMADRHALEEKKQS